MVKLQQCTSRHKITCDVSACSYLQYLTEEKKTTVIGGFLSMVLHRLCSNTVFWTLTHSNTQVHWCSIAILNVSHWSNCCIFCPPACRWRMAAAAAAVASSSSAPPAGHSGPGGETVHSCPSSRAAYPEHHEPGLQSSAPHPGPSALPQHGVPPRPVFYMSAPPPPPLLPYQWPLPFSYNSFPGFPGMGRSPLLPFYLNQETFLWFFFIFFMFFMSS